MTHLLLFRSCKSFVYKDNLNYGTHELIERNIAKSKYPLNDVRNGYNIPFGTEWKLIDYRIKKECLSSFVKDLDGYNLNPYPNNMTLFKLFKINKEDLSQKYSVGFLFNFIIWIMKWVNRKKTTSTILFIISILTLQLWLWAVILVILFNPLKPVPRAEEITYDLGKGKWAYHYIIGRIRDPTEKFINPKTNKTDYEQEDIL
jgi:hypothetical protein